MSDSQLASQPIPFGRRSPRGRMRWYLARVPSAQAASTAAKLKQLISKDLLNDSFVASRERWMKRKGIWALEVEPLYRGYAFLESADIAGLSNALAKVSLSVELTGVSDGTVTPIDDVVRKWLSEAMDANHVVRGSIAEIANGKLTILSGPLVGQEGRVLNVDRHKRVCVVRISERNGGFTERFALNVPSKS